jgi:phage N-6-adenine-methyltransferase
MSVDLFGVEHTDPSLTPPGMGSHHSATSKTDEWLTPPWIIKDLGPFDLDPCSPINRPWDTAAKHYTIADDGYSKPWEGRVWLNPPYSEAARWMNKLAHHGTGTALIFARTETAAWHDYVWPHATALLFLRGRLNFHFVDGRRADANAGAPSVLIAYGRTDAQILARTRIPGFYVPLRSTL